MIFVDTSALYALVDWDDAAHSSATAILQALLRDRRKLVSTNYVIVELLSLVQRRKGMAAVAKIIADVLPGIEHVIVDADLHDAALELCLGENRRHLSIVDCSSIAFMRRTKITRAFAFDTDFERFGIELVSL
ncbi:MAG TPA: PIN domain-containing protein [Candidatus Baltobacteraceae bacterium]|nr:PIN domain-containing protein [Candidatus Baltobacteraceae bacterium]